MEKNDKDESTEWIYTKTIRLRNGRVIHASSYGLKVFRFPMPNKTSNQ